MDKTFFLRVIVAVLSAYRRVRNDTRNFFLVYFSRVWRFFAPKKNKITILLLIALLATILMIYVTIKKPIPPDELVFFNEATGQTLFGEVYIDGEYVGDTSGVLQEIPSFYCQGSHEVVLKSGQHTLTWISKASDCELKKVVYTVRILNETSGSISLRFQVRERNETLAGNVLFDDVLQGFAPGEFKISEAACKGIGQVKLEANGTTIEWAHDPEWCTKFDPIVYSVGGMDLK